MKELSNRCLFFNMYHQFSITICSYCISFIFIIFLFIFFFIKFNCISSYNGFVAKGDDYYVVLYISDNGLQKLKKNVLVVDGKEYNYDIYMISDEYVLSESGPVRKVHLKFDLDNSDKIVNNVIKLNFVYKKTIFEYVKENLL